MPPDSQSASSSHAAGRKEGHAHRERIGNYQIGAEIGRGSFAKVYKGYRKSREPVAIKAVSRQKLTSKLLENLESEINILKAISHRNIVSLEECFKNDTHIYLVMEYCTGSDLSFYIKNRGKLPTLDFIPRPGMGLSGIPSEGDKVYWPHPPVGGIDERVTRCFLGQLAQAVRFLRSQNLIHRDIKPQNLLMQPATIAEIADGHPLGIPVLKVADFGFARILPAAAMAETLCGSPLYMAPEILRYEKYDAKADLWSVGAVLFEMAVGRPPFRASNHVELLRKIEKGEDRIKFPDESSKQLEPVDGKDAAIPVPVSADIKALIRRLLKRRPADRMGFDDFFSCGVWDGHMTESSEGSLSLEVSTDSSAVMGSRVREMVESKEQEKVEKVVPTRAPQPISDDSAMNPEPAPPAAAPVQLEQPAPATPPLRQPIRRTEPKYYVSDDVPAPITAPPATSSPSAPAATVRASPRPIVTADRAATQEKGPASIDDPPPVTPSSGPPPFARRTSRMGEGSPLAAAPPITMAALETGEDGSALDGSDSIVGREYVVVEKRTVEVNALADELDQASKTNTALVRRPSSRSSVVSRPVSAFKPASQPASSPVVEKAAVVPVSYSPPFALATTPPFAVPPTVRRPSQPISRPPSIPQALNVFPPSIPGFSPDSAGRYGTSPSSLQTGALARALTNTAMRLIGTGANQAATVIARAAAKRRPTIFRSSSEIDPAEDDVIRSVEDIARKAFVLFELADAKCVTWHQLVRNPSAIGPGSTPPFASAASPRRKSSSSSVNSEVMLLRQQEAAAGEAVVLYCKALLFIVQGTNRIQRYWEVKGPSHETSAELNEMVQWLRARFNECYEKADWAKARCAEELPFIDRLLHDKAREMSRHAAMAELQGDWTAAEAGFENSLWLLQALLDDVMYDEGHIREDDRISVEKLITPIKLRLEALRRKIGEPAREASGKA